MERLDKLSSGIRGQIMDKDKNHQPVASPAAANRTTSTSDAPQQILVHLGLAVRWEQDPSSSESHSWDLLPEGPLCAAPPISALR